MEADHPLKKWRIERGLSVAAVGRKIGCTRLSVERYEGGRMPKQPYLAASSL
jgi:transcriptional regulator with XRE-family HTH domain